MVGVEHCRLQGGGCHFFLHACAGYDGGLQYPLDGVVFDSLWKATLNVATSEAFTLHLNHPAPYLVFFSNPEA